MVYRDISFHFSIYSSYQSVSDVVPVNGDVSGALRQRGVHRLEHVHEPVRQRLRHTQQCMHRSTVIQQTIAGARGEEREGGREERPVGQLSSSHGVPLAM